MSAFVTHIYHYRYTLVLQLVSTSVGDDIREGEEKRMICSNDILLVTAGISLLSLSVPLMECSGWKEGKLVSMKVLNK
jgi:hypothetical protein